MIKLSSLPVRALDLADAVGDNLKHMAPRAGDWVSTGMKLGALRTGAHVAGGFLRRHPVLMVASVAGAGLLWYAAKRRSEQAEQGNTGRGTRSARGGNRSNAIEGSSRRVDARSGDESGTGTDTGGRKRSTSTAGARKRAGSTRGGQSSRGGDNASRSTTH